jgi:hypothetical protein
MTRRDEHTFERQFAGVVFVTCFGIFTTAGTQANPSAMSLESLVLTVGLGATLALFLAGTFAFLLRWVLQQSAARERLYLDEIKQQREAFQLAVLKIERSCPMIENHGGKR